MKITNIDLPLSWKWVKIGEIAKINPSIREMATQKKDIEVSFVPMTAVDANNGIIETPETHKLSEVRKGYTYFEDNDIIFAKITPCMQNGKHAIAKNLVNGIGFGSTEFHVIRPSIEVIPEWVYYFLRQSSYLHQAEKFMQGAVGQQRLPDDYLSNTIISLPPIDEQKRIVKIIKVKMKSVETMKQAAQVQQKVIDNLFLEVFDKV